MFSYHRRGGIRFLKIGRFSVTISRAKSQREIDSIAMAKRVAMVVASVTIATN